MSSEFQGLNDPTTGLVDLSVGTGDVSAPYAGFDGGSTGYFSTPSTQENSIAENMTLEVDLAADDWLNPATPNIIAKWGNTLPTDKGFRFRLTNGKPSIVFADGSGGNVFATSSAIVPFVNGTRNKIKAVVNQVTHITTFFANGVLLDAVSSAGLSAIQSNNTDITIGNVDGGGVNGFKGKIYSAKVSKGPTPEPYVMFDGSVGPYVSTPDSPENNIIQSFVIEIDAVIDDVDPDTPRGLFDHGIGTNPNKGIILDYGPQVLNPSGSGKFFRFFISPNGDGPSSQQGVEAAHNLVNGERFNLKAVYDSESTDIQLILNGTTIGSNFNTGVEQIHNSGMDVVVGAHITSTTDNPSMVGRIYSATLTKGPTPDAYARFNGEAGTFITAPNAPAYRITGDMVIDVEVEITKLPSAGLVRTLINHGSGSGNRSYDVAYTTNGIQFTISGNGTSIQVATAPVSFVVGKKFSIKAIYSAATTDIQVFVDNVGGVVNNTGITALHDTISDVHVGAWSLTEGVVEGLIYSAKVYNGVGVYRSLAVDFDPYPYLQGDASWFNGTTEWTLQGDTIVASGIDDGVKVDLDPYPYIQGDAGWVTDTGEWTLQGSAIATSPIDDGVKVDFNPAQFPDPAWTAHGTAVTVNSAELRGMYVEPTAARPFPIYASTGQALASASGGLTFDADGRLRITSTIPATPVNLSGGLIADAATEALVVSETGASVWHQGVALTNEGYLGVTYTTPIVVENDFDDAEYGGGYN
jgi:hypothetical protein